MFQDEYFLSVAYYCDSLHLKILYQPTTYLPFQVVDKNGRTGLTKMLRYLLFPSEYYKERLDRTSEIADDQARLFPLNVSNFLKAKLPSIAFNKLELIGITNASEKTITEVTEAIAEAKPIDSLSWLPETATMYIILGTTTEGSSYLIFVNDNFSFDQWQLMNYLEIKNRPLMVNVTPVILI